MCLGTGTPFGVNDGYENIPYGAKGARGVYGSRCFRHKIFMYGSVEDVCPNCKHLAAELRRLSYHPPGKHRHGCYSICPEMTDREIVSLMGLRQYEISK